jgi:hypothetical protein
MSDDQFVVSLAGRQWSLPHLPFRAIKAIQPILFEVYTQAGGAAISTESVGALTEGQLDRLAEAIWRAIAHVDPALSLDGFLALPFSVGDLIETFPAIARAVGLRSVRPNASPDRASAFLATAEAPAPMGKSISTP